MKNTKVAFRQAGARHPRLGADKVSGHGRLAAGSPGPVMTPM
jgi:hypothetical protein